MVDFNILHLTDLHYGLEAQKGQLPGVRSRFLKDLRSLMKGPKSVRWGPPDLVLFTGDLVQKGAPEEFRALSALVEELWEAFHEAGGETPLLLAVPGNHDLKRPDPRASIKVITMLAETNDVDVWDDLLKRRGGEYQAVVDDAFAHYMTWWRGCPHGPHKARSNLTFHEGVLPGDFSATVIKEGASLGILGLNSTFVQLLAGDFNRKLAIHNLQFHAACRGDGERWSARHHACVLLTHQPPGWLAPSYENEFTKHIDSSDRFAAHFCGHLHKSEARNRGIGGGAVRRLKVGSSLFGLEAQPGVRDPIVGYALYRLQLDGDEGSIRAWPRIEVPWI